MKRLVMGILAHVDAGKTTLSEGMLYRAGEIRKLGRVDAGDTFLDTHSLERERGITIFSKLALLRLEQTECTLLDTPGHVDFSTEMERTLQVLDMAVLVISGTDGVQSHTETLWRLLSKYRLPTFLFVNKMDLTSANREKIFRELKSRLSGSIVSFDPKEPEEALWENTALCEEALLDRYLETGMLSTEEIAKAISSRTVFPCFFGSALKLKGVDELLLGVDRYRFAPDYPKEFGAKVFKISEDEQGNRLTFLKITGGSLRVKASLRGFGKEKEPWEEKINQLRIYSGSKYQLAEEALPGMICAATGLTHTYPGEGLGTQSESDQPLLQPVLNYRVLLPEGADAYPALQKFLKLEEEEPELHVVWNEPLQEIHVQLMGEVQLEVLKSLCRERFQMEIGFGPGKILYKETIENTVEGVGHFEPLRHYAEVHLLLEPGERGSGLTFSSACREDDLDGSLQRLILTHLEEKNHIGVLIGAPITDMKITLIAGRAHLKHTEGGDFREATYRAVRQGLKTAKSLLLEPWYDFRLEVPPDMIGRGMSDLQKRWGSFTPPQLENGMSVLRGSVPVSAVSEYQREVVSYTRGKGRFSCMLRGYEPCHNSEEVQELCGYDSLSDLENPSDSVFCSHGAGMIVKWNQVREYMHIDTGFGREKTQEQETVRAEPVRRASDFASRLQEDRELLKIFERTYGPIRRDSFRAFEMPKPEPSDALYQSPSEGSGVPEYLLVDGYNILFAWDDLKELARANVDAARQALIDILCNYQGFKQCELILVFDAYRVKGNPGEIEKFHGIHVVYTKEAETADMYIEKVTKELGKKRRVRVATSDGLEQLIILGHGALRVSASAFLEEVAQVNRSIQSLLEYQARSDRKSSLGELVVQKLIEKQGGAVD